jgi:membrane associated rhomboid family serine protease
LVLLVVCVNTIAAVRMLGMNEPPAVSMPLPRRARPRAELKRVLRQRTASVPGTYVLLAANVAIFAAVAIAAESIRSFSPRDLIWWGANFGPRTTNGEWWRLLTATVLHAHLPHLIFNMIALLMVGPIVERLVGWWSRQLWVILYSPAEGGGVLPPASGELTASRWA